MFTNIWGKYFKNVYPIYLHKKTGKLPVNFLIMFKIIALIIVAFYFVLGCISWFFVITANILIRLFNYFNKT